MHATHQTAGAKRPSPHPPMRHGPQPKRHFPLAAHTITCMHASQPIHITIYPASPRSGPSAAYSHSHPINMYTSNFPPPSPWCAPDAPPHPTPPTQMRWPSGAAPSWTMRWRLWTARWTRRRAGRGRAAGRGRRGGRWRRRMTCRSWPTCRPSVGGGSGVGTKRRVLTAERMRTQGRRVAAWVGGRAGRVHGAQGAAVCCSTGPDARCHTCAGM